MRGPAARRTVFHTKTRFHLPRVGSFMVNIALKLRRRARQRIDTGNPRYCSRYAENRSISSRQNSEVRYSDDSLRSARRDHGRDGQSRQWRRVAWSGRLPVVLPRARARPASESSAPPPGASLPLSCRTRHGSRASAWTLELPYPEPAPFAPHRARTGHRTSTRSRAAPPRSGLGTRGAER